MCREQRTPALSLGPGPSSSPVYVKSLLLSDSRATEEGGGMKVQAFGRVVYFALSANEL